MALLSILLPVFFLLFSLGELARFRVLNEASLGPVDILVLAFIIIWLCKVKKNTYILLKPIIIFVGIATFSLIINLLNFSKEQVLISSLYLIRWLIYSFMYFVFRDISMSQSKKVRKYIILSGVLILIAGFAQFVFYPSLKGWYHLGWDEHLNRLFSSFLDPNFAGAILVLFFVFVFVLKDELFEKRKNLSYLLLAITFLAIILTYSRGAILMFVSVAFVYSLLKKRWKIFGGTILLITAVFLILSPGFYLENTNLLRTVSTQQRIGTSVKALQIFQKNPLGVGFDTYRYARQKYGEVDISKSGPSHSGAGVDNSLVFVLATTGVFGLTAYFYLLFSLFKLGYSRLTNKYGLILVVSLFGLTINSLTINSLFYSFIMLWIWILAGLTESN